jgi:transcriptional regulator with XRE-family HTH domain
MARLSDRQKFERDLKEAILFLGPVELARRLEVTRQTVWFWENGKWPRADKLLALYGILEELRNKHKQVG